MISIIVPCSGRAAHVRRLCDSILKQVNLNTYEVLVVCNPPSAKIRKILATYPSGFKYFDCKSRGANTARNIGVTHAKGKYLFFFDDDCELITPTFLSENTKLLDQRDDVLACGGGYLPKNSVMDSIAAAYYFIQSKWLSEGQLDDGYHRYLIGGNMAIRKTAFERYGLFNEKMKFGGTETEFFRRLEGEGQKIIFLPDSVVSHDYQISFLGFLKKAFMQGLGGAFMEASFGKSQNKKLVYGQQAYFKMLNINTPPLKTLYWYRLSFEAGGCYYKNTSSAKPKAWAVYWAIFNYVFLQKKLATRYWERRLRVIGNYREHLYQKK